MEQGQPVRDVNGQPTFAERELPEVAVPGKPTVTSPPFIMYTNDTALTTDTDANRRLEHQISYNTGIGAEYTPASNREGVNCNVRYTYTFYNANRDLESRPATPTETLAVNRLKPVSLTGFDIPQESGNTELRLYRVCPEYGETQFTQIRAIPFSYPDGELSNRLLFTDFLNRARLGDLKYDSARNLVFEERNAEGALIDTHIIVFANGQRNNAESVQGFAEEYEKYL